MNKYHFLLSFKIFGYDNEQNSVSNTLCLEYPNLLSLSRHPVEANWPPFCQIESRPFLLRQRWPGDSRAFLAVSLVVSAIPTTRSLGEK